MAIIDRRMIENHEARLGPIQLPDKIIRDIIARLRLTDFRVLGGALVQASLGGASEVHRKLSRFNE